MSYVQLGGGGGSHFDDGVYTGIRQLVVVYGAAIDSIQIEYDKKGSSVWSDKHGGGGGSAGTRIGKIKLDYPNEVITSLSGYFGSIANGSPVIVQSLAFESNQAKYGPYGRQQGTHFSFPMTGGKLVGIHGKCGRYLDSIGVHLKPYPSNSLLPAQIEFYLGGEEEVNNNSLLKNSSSRQSSETKEFTVVSFPSYAVKEPHTNGVPVTNGPWGSSTAGSMFDDGVYTGVRQINLQTVSSAILNIEVIYDRHGQKITGSRHGPPTPPGYLYFYSPKDEIIFDYPHEVLTHISGYHGPAWPIFETLGQTTIQSLTFHTTKQKYGPFGEEKGIFFTSNIKAGMIVGFHGRSGMGLYSIGVHVLEEKLPSPQPTLPKRGLGGKVVSGVVKEPVPSGPIPWGGDGGRIWDDGIFSGMKPIFVTSGQSNINFHYKGASDYFDTNLSMTGTGNLYSLPSTQSAQRGHT